MSGIKGMNAGKQNIRYVHGETKTRLHRIWGCMHERCERVKHAHYDAYGGRGIKVCDEWKEYLPFAEWARSNGYTDELTIDRIDVNGNYEPSNCRWVTMKEQHNNKRNNRILLYHGETYTLTQLAEKVGINKTTLKERINLGYGVLKMRLIVLLDREQEDIDRVQEWKVRNEYGCNENDTYEGFARNL